MKTLLLSASDPITAPTAANLIMNGELVAIPTETVYGLGADALNEEADFSEETLEEEAHLEGEETAQEPQDEEGVPGRLRC